MKRIKKVWEENKVLLVLAIILIICLVVFLVVLMTYFYGTSDSVYGNRLDNIKENSLNETSLKEIEDTLENDASVTSVSLNIKGLVIYINIDFKEKIKMDDAKKIAASSLELFKEEELKVYDLEYIISSPSTDDFVGYTLMGAKNANGSDVIIWNNYNLKEESKK